MASKIQVARGSLNARDPKTLLDAELFWVPSNVSQDGEKDLRDNTDLPYDTGTLYIGRPSSLVPSDNKSSYIPPMPIAGERSYKGLVYRGDITDQTGIYDANGNIYNLFKYVRVGDFFIFKNWAKKGGQFEKDGFKDGDILLITEALYDIAPDVETDVGGAKDIKYVRIHTAAPEARNVEYTPSDGMTSDNVQDAIDELNFKKLSYKGRIPDDFTLDSLMTSVDSVYSGNPGVLTPGALYLVTESGINVKGTNLKGLETVWTTVRGDFLVWQNDTLGWLSIPSGFNASKLEFDPTEAVARQKEFGTFTEDLGEHILSTENLTDVQAALTYLLSNKAMLDSDGKVPLSQLHSTVLGAMQYKGTWDPVIAGASFIGDDLEHGYNAFDMQNNWPSAENEKPDVAGDEESSLTSGTRKNKPGDYYIVSTPYSNIRYADKDQVIYDSTGKVESVARYLDLNSGDWIVYTDIGNGKGKWEVIDNTDKINGLNFTINGKKVIYPDYLDTPFVSTKIGTPSFATDGKLVIYENGGVEVFSGVRLVDQDPSSSMNESQIYHLPVYTKDATDTLAVSTLENLINSSGIAITRTHSNVYIGSEVEHFEEFVYGNIYINPHIEVEDSLTKQVDSGLTFVVTSGKAATLFADPSQEDKAEFILPTKSSKVVGKLKGVTFIPGRLTKSIEDGYIESTSIQEHMKAGTTTYNDDDIVSVEFHSPVVDVNNIETRHITFGQRGNLDDTKPNGGLFSEDGRLLTDEKTSSLYAHGYQKSDVTNVLPQNSGVLVNDNDWKKDIVGTEGTMPIYGKPDVRDGELNPRATMIDSRVKQIGGALFDLLFTSKTDIRNAKHTIDGEDGLDINIYNGYTDEKYNNEKHGELVENEDGTSSYKGTKDNVILESDTVIGELEETDNGYKVKVPRALMVTKGLLLGNNATGTTHIVPGRTMFPNDSQYFDPRTDEPIPEKDVYLELPSVSGVLLGSNSRIDGGVWII